MKQLKMRICLTNRVTIKLLFSAIGPLRYHIECQGSSNLSVQGRLQEQVSYLHDNHAASYFTSFQCFQNFLWTSKLSVYANHQKKNRTKLVHLCEFFEKVKIYIQCSYSVYNMLNFYLIKKQMSKADIRMEYIN